MLTWFWHRYVLRHTMIHHPAIAPTYRTPGGINVFEQDKFEIPIAHWKCSCGTGEIWEDRDMEYVLVSLSLLVAGGTAVLGGIVGEHIRRRRKDRHDARTP